MPMGHWRDTCPQQTTIKPPDLFVDQARSLAGKPDLNRPQARDKSHKSPLEVSRWDNEPQS